MNKLSFIIIACLAAWSVSCGPQKKIESSETGEAKPEYGGTLIYAKNGPPITLDPALTKETESTVIADNVFDALVQQRAGKIAIDPCLAKSWDISKDGKTRTQIDKGIALDGKPFELRRIYKKQ